MMTGLNSTDNNNNGTNSKLEPLYIIPNIQPARMISKRGEQNYRKKDMGHDFVSKHRGPTSTSNWLIPNRFLMSAYPGDRDDNKAREKIRAILKSGIRTFVNLQTVDEANRFTEYKSIVISEFEAMSSEERDLHGPLIFTQFEIPDCYVAKDELVHLFVSELIVRYRSGENILIHCWGGHGRTGTISCIFLSRLYNLGVEEALKYVAMVHDCRDEARSCSPQTESQFRQVRQLCNNQSLNL